MLDQRNQNEDTSVCSQSSLSRTSYNFGLQRQLKCVCLLVLSCCCQLSTSFQCQPSLPMSNRFGSLLPLAAAAQVSSTPSDSAASSKSVSYYEADPGKAPGAIGEWENIHGNWVLAPPMNDEPPRALLHFLGGAIVGSAPHITYRYMLERLAGKGYLIVATPYQLSFDHLETCDNVISRFERMAPTIARQYGALPVVGIGHSCGALLQLLITSLFPDTPRAANALMSFNNKPVKEAVPFFEEVFAPLFTAIAARNSTVPGLPSGSKTLSLSLQLLKAATEGKVPSDELFTEFSRTLLVPGLPFGNIGNEGLKIPKELRDTLAQIAAPPTTALADAGVLPLMNQLVHGLEQIPQLIDEVRDMRQVADGARDFTPTPTSVRAAARKAYRARRTLILQYSDDALDESEVIEELLSEARSVTRMRRPMVAIDLERRVLEGGHAAPLMAPPLDLATRAEDVLGVDAAKERLLYQQADATVEELARWLEEGNL